MKSFKNYINEGIISGRGGAADKAEVMKLRVEKRFRENLVNVPDFEIVDGKIVVDGNTVPNKIAFKSSCRDLTPPLPMTTNCGYGFDYVCSNTAIKTLKGVPIDSVYYFDCSNTSITTLKDGPVSGINHHIEDYICMQTDILNLEGAPKTVGGDFSCSFCQDLTSLEDAPKTVGGSFVCSVCNDLATLEGAPETVKQDFICSECRNLTSLKGIPKRIGGSLYLNGCNSLNFEDPNSIPYKIKVHQVYFPETYRDRKDILKNCNIHADIMYLVLPSGRGVRI